MLLGDGNRITIPQGNFKFHCLDYHFCQYYCYCEFFLLPAKAWGLKHVKINICMKIAVEKLFYIRGDPKRVVDGRRIEIFCVPFGLSLNLWLWFWFQWKPRKNAQDNGPKTITEVREEAAKDFGMILPNQTRLSSMNMFGGPMMMNGNMMGFPGGGAGFNDMFGGPMGMMGKRNSNSERVKKYAQL